MRSATLILSCLLLWPAAAGAQTLTIEAHPGNDPRTVIACSLDQRDPMMHLTEVLGMGLPGKQTTWVSRAVDRQILLDAVGTLMSGRLPATGQHILTTPAPPYVSVTWKARTLQGIAFGVYLQQGLDLPEPLGQVLREVIPGGLCDRVLGR